MKNEFDNKPGEIMNASLYLGRDLRELDQEEFQKLVDHYSTYHRSGFTDELLGEHLGQEILALKVRKSQASQGNPHGVAALQEPWIFTEKDPTED